MAREILFPKTRHVALSGVGQAAEAKALGTEAILVPIQDALRATPPAGIPLPEPATPGDPGVPAKGDLPAAAAAPGLEAGPQPPAPQVRELPWLVAADLSEPSGEGDLCRAADGSSAGVRCVSSLEGREAASELSAKAARVGDAVLLEGLDRWYRLAPASAGYCRSCELALIEALRESYGEHLQP